MSKIHANLISYSLCFCLNDCVLNSAFFYGMKFPEYFFKISDSRFFFLDSTFWTVLFKDSVVHLKFSKVKVSPPVWCFLVKKN